MKYDAFISYSSAQQRWAEALASNLQTAGRRVFFAPWSLVPGRHWIPGIDTAIDESSAAILIVSPEALESGWVREEYEKLKRRGNARDFPIVPVIHSRVEAQLPFIGNIHHVDFRPPRDYRSAFARLLGGLDGEAPGPNPDYDGELRIPEEAATLNSPQSPDHLERVRDLILGGRMVVVFARGGVSVSEIAATIGEQSRKTMGPANVRHLLPAYAPAYAAGDQPSPDFFRDLAEQGAFGDGVASASDFRQRIAAHLGADRPLLLIITGIEHATEADRTGLCKTLRALDHKFQRLKVVFFGGERLNELRYMNEEHSLLSHAEPVVWPDPALRAVAATVATEPDGFGDEAITRVAQLSGGQAALARELFLALRDGCAPEELGEVVAGSSAVWAALAPLAREETTRDHLEGLVEAERLGRNMPFLLNPLLRRLYWEGLVAERGGGSRELVWCSPAVREAVRGLVREFREASA